MSQSCHMTAMVVCKPAFGIVSKVAFQFFSRYLIDVPVQSILEEQLGFLFCWVIIICHQS
ncbi:hypothetical protein CK203_058059 [Vitis vinifera]|uniref:Uncharacterized protein n=1 Tax=Vitis vinifera TaxID=29760 RepID=A0A438GF14_VITVI|nr:hypothetical protein CK203_058059 [Vitis vinifera]